MNPDIWFGAAMFLTGVIAGAGTATIGILALAKRFSK